MCTCVYTHVFPCVRACIHSDLCALYVYMDAHVLAYEVSSELTPVLEPSWLVLLMFLDWPLPSQAVPGLRPHDRQHPQQGSPQVYSQREFRGEHGLGQCLLVRVQP